MSFDVIAHALHLLSIHCDGLKQVQWALTLHNIL